MNIRKSVTFAALGLVLCIGAFAVSKIIIDNQYEQNAAENRTEPEEQTAELDLPTDIDRMISHTVLGTEETALPVEYEQDYTIYEDSFYVTLNHGQSWLPVPDDKALGYARISEYNDLIAKSNIHIAGNKVSIVYGGRGAENISIITTDSFGEVWSVGSISRTATHDLEKGYDELYIDFPGDEQTGYLAAVRDSEILAFRSVNSGVTWDPVGTNEPLFDEIMSQFELQGMNDEQE